MAGVRLGIHSCVRFDRSSIRQHIAQKAQIPPIRKEQAVQLQVAAAQRDQREEVPVGSWWSFSPLEAHESPQAVIFIRNRRPDTPPGVVGARVYTTASWGALSKQTVSEVINPHLATSLSELPTSRFLELVAKGELERIDSSKKS